MEEKDKQGEESQEEFVNEVCEAEEKTPKPSLKVWSKNIEITQTKTIKRLTFRGLMGDVAEAINLDKGLLYTLKGLTIRPGQTIQEYLDDKRFLVTNPIKYFLLIVGTTLLIASQTGFFENVEQLREGFEYGFTKGSTDKEVPDDIKVFEEDIIYFYQNYFIKYQNIFSIITIFFTSIFTYLFFRKQGFNFVEHNIINTYIFVHTYLVFAVVVIFNIQHESWAIVYMFAYFLMMIIAFKHLFMVSWWKSIYKTILSYLASLMIFYLIFFIAGIVWAMQNLSK